MHEYVYHELPKLSRTEIEAALDRDVPEELLEVVLSAALYCEDRDFAEEVCLRLSDYPHFNVKGNAILGLAHIARIDGSFDEAKVIPIILRGLQDVHEYVRGHALDAKEDIEHYTGFKF